MKIDEIFVNYGLLRDKFPQQNFQIFYIKNNILI